MEQQQLSKPPLFEVGKLHQGLTYDQYASAEGLRASHLHELKKSPAHLVEALKNPKKASAAMEFGSLVHSILEDAEAFRQKIVVEPEFIGFTKDGRPSARSGEAVEKKKAWHAEMAAQGKTIVSSDEFDTCMTLVKAIGEHKILKQLLKGGIREVSGWVQCPDTGVILAFRPDIITEYGFMVSFKTTRDARPDYWLGPYGELFGIRKRHYILSEAHYAYCAKLLKLPKPESVVIVAIENTKPCGIRIYPLDSGCLDVGEQWRRMLTRKYAECKESGIWPGYDEAAYAVTPPEFPSLPIDESLYDDEVEV